MAQAGSTIRSADTLFVHVDSSIVDAGVGGTDNLDGAILAGAIEITGNPDNDTLRGTPLADLLDGFTGADLMIGDGGNDTYRVDNAGDVVIENAAEGTDTVLSATHFALPANVENLTLQSLTGLQGYGNTLANTMIGSFASDLLDGGAGADLMLGGVGNDTYFVDTAGDAVIENANEGNDAVFASVNYGLRRTWKPWCCRRRPAGLRQQPAQLDLRQQRQQSARWRRRSRYHERRDRERHLLRRQCGRYGGREPGQGNDTVFASVHFGLSANVENLILQGGADLQGYGNDPGNVIYGNTGNNLLNGFAGADLMVGGAGNDTYFVDDTSDAAFESPGRATMRCSQPRITGWRRTWKPWCCRAAPTCRATATTRPTHFTVTAAITCSTAPGAATP